MLVRNEIKQESQGVIVLHECFQDSTLLGRIQVFLADNCAQFSWHQLLIRPSRLLLLLPDNFDAPLERLHQFLALLAVLVFFQCGLLCPLFPSIDSLLVGNLLLEFLYLVKASDEAVFEVLFDVGRDHLDVVVGVVHLAVVQFILYEVRQLLIIILAVRRVGWPLALKERPIELGLEFVGPRSGVPSSRLLLVLGRGAQVVRFGCSRGRVSLFVCAQRCALLVAVRGPTGLLLQYQGLRTACFLYQIAAIADYLALWVVDLWVVAFARLIHNSRLNMTARLYVTTSWLYVTAWLDRLFSRRKYMVSWTK